MSRVLDTVIWYVVTFGDGPVVMCMYQIRSPTDCYAGGVIPADALPIVTAGAASLAVSGLANATQCSVVESLDSNVATRRVMGVDITLVGGMRFLRISRASLVHRCHSSSACDVQETHLSVALHVAELCS